MIWFYTWEMSTWATIPSWWHINRPLGYNCVLTPTCNTQEWLSYGGCFIETLCRQLPAVFTTGGGRACLPFLCLWKYPHWNYSRIACLFAPQKKRDASGPGAFEHYWAQGKPGALGLRSLVAGPHLGREIWASPSCTWICSFPRQITSGILSSVCQALVWVVPCGYVPNPHSHLVEWTFLPPVGCIRRVSLGEVH